MSAARRIPRWLWFVAAPLVLVALAVVAIAVLLPPARLRTWVQAELSRRLTRAVRFEDARVAGWPWLRLEVRQLELAEPGGFANGSAVTVATTSLDLDVWALLSRRLRVQRLELRSPALHLVRYADGHTNLDGLVAPSAPGATRPSPLDLDLRAFAIRDGRVLLDDVAAQRRTAFGLATRMSVVTRERATRIATEGDTRVTGLATGPLTAQRLADLDGTWAPLEWTITHRGTYDTTQQRLALESLALRFGRTRLEGRGVVDRVGPQARADLRIQGEDLDVAQLLSWASHAPGTPLQGVTGRGTLAFDVRVRGALEPGTRPEVVGTVRLRDGALRAPQAPAEVSGLVFDAALRPDSVRVTSLRAVVAGQPVTASLVAWSFADPHVAFALRGDLDLAVLAPLVAPRDVKLSGRTVVDMQGHGRVADMSTLVLAGEARLANVRFASPALPKPLERIEGRLAFAEDVARVEGLSLRAGTSSIALDGRVTNPLALMAAPSTTPPAEVAFELRSPGLDLADLQPTTPGAPFLPNARGEGHVRITRLVQQRLDVRDVQADVRLEPAVLEVPRFALAGYGGTVQGDARFDLRDTRRPGWTVHANVASVQADSLLAAWTPARGLLAGTLDTRLTFAGEGRSRDDLEHTLTLVALSSIREGRLGPGPALEAIATWTRVPRLRQVDFSRLDLPLRIEHGRIITDPVVLNGAAGEWRLVGAVGFDGALDYAVSVTLPPAAIEALAARSALAAGALADPQGRLLLDLRVTGTARAPHVAWDTRAMQARLAGRATEALAEQRARLADEARAAAQRTLERSLTPNDSTGRTPPLTARSARDTLASAARGLLRGFFGRGDKVAVPDTTRH